MMALGAFGGGPVGGPRLNSRTPREWCYTVETRSRVGVGKWKRAAIGCSYLSAARAYGDLIHNGRGEARVLNPDGAVILEGLRGQRTLPLDPPVPR